MEAVLKIQFYEENAGIQILQMLNKFMCVCARARKETNLER